MRAGHRRPKHLEIMVVDLEHPGAELVAPPRRVLDEVELVEQGPDGRLGTLEEVDVAAPRREVGRHLDLIGLVVGDLPDRGERLEWFTLGIVRLGRVEDDPVTSCHLAQHVRSAVSGLRETPTHPSLDVVAADRVDPVRHDLDARRGG